MRNDITVAKDQLPAAVRALIRGDRVDVTLCESVEIGSLQWDGGTQDTYTLVELATGRTKAITDTRPWPQNMHPLGSTALPAGFVIVRGGTFCGKPSAGRVYARATDVASALPAPAPELPHALRQVLAALDQYNSKGRERFRADASMSRATWESLVSQLCDRALCDARGRVTVKGSNVARTIGSSILNPYSPEFKA